MTSATTGTQIDLDNLCVNAIRGLALDAVQTAQSGHPGLPLGAAGLGYVLWTKHLRFNPKNPHWFNRDRFILSAGHGCMLQYALLHMCGFDLPLSELKRFRQLYSLCPGHPENHITPGVEMATGPLGQGISHSVGFAAAEAFLAAKYNRPGHELIDHFTYGICSDGDLMEGVSNEAASLAGHLGLGKLIFLYDDNGITIDGTTKISFTEDVEARYKALGWHTQRIDGENIPAIEAAVEASKAVTDKPSLILAKTIIGYGSPHLQGTNKIHSNPLKPEEFILTKQNLGLSTEVDFSINPEALAHYRTSIEVGAQLEADWEKKLDSYANAYPAEAAELKAAIAGEFNIDWDKALPKFTDKLATRKAGQAVIQSIAEHFPLLLGGSADLDESNLTRQEKGGDFQPESYGSVNMHFGIREHAMAAAVNGITLHGATRGYGSSFMVFTDYARPSLRLSALMYCPSIFVFTHDSIGVGEDGPTHEPVEHLTALRVIPNFNVIRPADGNETSAAWKMALTSKDHPTLLALTRQAVPALTPDNVANHPSEKGAYILLEASGPAKLTLIGTGSELQLCVAARETLEASGIPTRVVSMPSWFLFERQSTEYKSATIDRSIPTVSVEAGSTMAWPRYSDAQVGVDRFGLSAPGDQVMKELGITVEHVLEAARNLLAKG